MITSLIPSFNSGELSPLIHLRSDLEKYRSGCRTLQNMLITPYGGARRRPGLSFVAQAPGKCRVFRFQASLALGYVLEASALKIRLYSRDSLVQASGGGNLEIATPYTEADLASLQMVQVNSLAYFVHPLYPVYRLARISESVWTFTEVAWEYPAMLDENLDETVKLTTQAGKKNDVITITSNVAMFSTKHENAHFQISHERAPNQFEVKCKAQSGGVASSEILVLGKWNFSTAGTWNGKFNVQRYRDNAWESIRTYASSSDANFTGSGETLELTRMKITYDYLGSGSSSPHAVLETSGSFIRGLVRITKVNSSTSCTATVINQVMAGATSYWREGAWSAYRGYPRSVAAHEQRLCYGGNTYRPQTIWGSAVDDFENFEPGVEEGDSYTHTLVSGTQNDIQWLLSARALLIGTSGDEWVLSGSSDDGRDSKITPTSVRARRHSGNGSAYLKAKLIDENAIFVQRGGRVVREMRFSFEADGYVTQDLTMLAEHIAQGTIIDTAWQTQPDSILWCVTGDGKLLGLTYDRTQQVVGWHRHETGNASDGFESVAIKQTEGEIDQVWVSVRRTINGTTRRYIERLNPDGFYLKLPWDLKDPTSGGAWATKWLTYGAGNVLLSSATKLGSGVANTIPFSDGASDLIYCLITDTATEAHLTPDLGNTFTPAGSQRWVKLPAWTRMKSESRTFEIGGGTYHSGVVYKAIVSSSPAVDYATTEPGVGSAWETSWEYVADIPPINPVEFLASESYLVGNRVTNAGTVYECIGEHVPVVAKTPGTGASWATYWVVVARGTYSSGDVVSSDGANYVCTANHTPADATRPSFGVDWQTKWDLQVASPNLLFYVDSGKSLFNVTLSEFTGLSHLEGQTVQVVANSIALAPRVVSSGKILLDQEGDPTGPLTDISVGIGYESILQPMALELGMQNGTSVGREKRVHELMIVFKDTYGCKVSTSLAGTFDTLSFYDTSQAGEIPLFSGAYVHKLDSRHEFDAGFVLKQDLPLPMTVLAIVPKFNVYGDN